MDIRFVIERFGSAEQKAVKECVHEYNAFIVMSIGTVPHRKGSWNDTC